MDLPKIPTGMFDDIKSRFNLGQGRRDAYDQAYDDYDGYDEYDEYLDYGEYGYDEERDGGYGGMAPASSQYDPYAPVTTRSVGSSRDAGYPKLVSISDVKRTTAVPESLMRDPLSNRSGMGRVVVDSTAPAPSSPAAMAEERAQQERAESLGSLFTPTAPAVPQPAAAAAAPAPAPVSAQPETPAAAYDPYAAFEGISAASHEPSRSCVVLRPKAYGDAEKVAKTLRAGDVAVLCLKDTSDQLAKRILDFSFGAATALDASVDYAAEKVFVLATGPGLTDQERRGLQSQGVL